MSSGHLRPSPKKLVRRQLKLLLSHFPTLICPGVGTGSKISFWHFYSSSLFNSTTSLFAICQYVRLRLGTTFAGQQWKFLNQFPNFVQWLFNKAFNMIILIPFLLQAITHKLIAPELPQLLKLSINNPVDQVWFNEPLAVSPLSNSWSDQNLPGVQTCSIYWTEQWAKRAILQVELKREGGCKKTWSLAWESFRATRKSSSTSRTSQAWLCINMSRIYHDQIQNNQQWHNNMRPFC